MKPLISLVVVAFSVVCCGGDISALDDQALSDQDLSQIVERPSVQSCGTALPGFTRCHAKVQLGPQGKTMAAPGGFGPTDLVSAYKIPNGGHDITVAIVDAYDAPKAEADLAVYRTQFGLPPCTTQNGCFKKVNQLGQTSPMPTADAGWAEEIMLDLDMVSAACPQCNILFVAANTASMDDLGAAVNTAVQLGANVVSNSYGGGESSADASYDSKYFNHPGVLITVSSGDSGYGVEYPAASPYVLAVGGTSLVKSSATRGWAEKAWNGAGSGCSKYSKKASYQKDTGCKNRTVADVSAVADPSTGVAVYDSYSDSQTTANGWMVFGGTSVAAPLVAAIYAASGKTSAGPGWAYANPKAFYDVTSGTNGTCPKTTKYLCTGGTGYDGPTGLGTPNGSLLASGK